ncbi:hypothetical protein [Psychroflexus sediminis]|uniref:DUF4292 domain-containing protein n=1 Tax=Psychroflexus sediminis TaxID=470826 RepID=A0A1G7YND0_9FLAO|nr:hypothetical protein [Psychroflexus sediminis]SDG97947.1 hypothetical protein SAMN04488027_11351 [Psychroflexus sediminis]
MKKHRLSLILILILFSWSCSEENDTFLNSDADYFPLEVENSWIYENRLNQNTGNFQGTELLSIDEKFQNRYGFTQTSDELVGIFTSMLASGKAYKQNGNQKIILDGQFTIDLENQLSTIEIPMQDIVLYDANSSLGNMMSSSSGKFQQNINDFPVDFSYRINSVHQGFSISKEINGVNYEDIFVSEIQVYLSAKVFIVFNDFTILQEQEITSITNYYAKDIGLIFSDVRTDIIFEDIPEQLEIDIPDVNFNSTQELESYLLNPSS